MAVKYQYNKTSLQQLNKQLEVRERILPSLKNKESALRMEVQLTRDRVHSLDRELTAAIRQYEENLRLWVEFDPVLVSIQDVELDVKKIAGVNTPGLKDVRYSVKGFSVFTRPKWYLDGIVVLKNLTSIALERKIIRRKMELLEHARRKTTQKVNLYEKIQFTDSLAPHPAIRIRRDNITPKCYQPLHRIWIFIQNRFVDVISPYRTEWLQPCLHPAWPKGSLRRT